MATAETQQRSLPPSRWCSSANVASGCAATCRRSSSRSIFTTRTPPMGLGVVRCSSRRTCLTRRAQAGLTAKVRAIWRVVMPRSYAASTRSRRSWS